MSKYVVETMYLEKSKPYNLERREYLVSVYYLCKLYHLVFSVDASALTYFCALFLLFDHISDNNRKLLVNLSFS
jgi:hypothetical protein